MISSQYGVGAALQCIDFQHHAERSDVDNLDNSMSPSKKEKKGLTDSRV